MYVLSKSSKQDFLPAAYLPAAPTAYCKLAPASSSANNAQPA